jgi:acetylglutamate kinase
MSIAATSSHDAVPPESPANPATPATPSASARPLVVKLGGALLDDAAAHGAVFEALAALHNALPGGLVIVHGGGKAIDRQLDRLGLATERREGIRITPPEVVEQVAGVLAGQMNTQLLGLLLARGVPAVGLTLSDGFLAHASRCTRYSFDPGCVGELTHGDGALVTHLLAAGYLPILSSIGVDARSGGMLNINADDAAAQIAGILRARGLLLLTDVPGVRGADGATMPRLEPADAEALIASGVIAGGMIAKVRSAVAAANASGVPVVIASWADPGALGALALGQGVGTVVVPATASATSSPHPPAREFAHHA